MHPIGHVSTITGVNIATIRYYERIGIIPALQRSAAGRRLFSATDIGLLRFVKRCRDLGFSIADTRNLMQVADKPDTCCTDVLALSQHHLVKIRCKITDLQNLEKALTELSAHCSAGNTDCPMLDKLMAD
jgi:MerR family mercuric resistance operon transcriptional regulator